jgi:hypothetical protein
MILTVLRGTFKVFLFSILVMLSGCQSQMEISAGKVLSITDIVDPDVTVEVAQTQSIGVCSFTATPDPFNAAGFSFKVIFSEQIDSTTFDISDITNSGTGVVVWSLQNCGDSRTFKLSATSISTDGTVIPEIAAAAIKDSSGNDNDASTSIDNSITIDRALLNVTIEQAISQTVGSCTFVAVTEPAGAVGFSYRVTFSKSIAPSSFTTSDISNSGTGGSTSLVWSLQNCGDNKNFKLTASSIHGNGTIIPSLLAGLVTDAATNTNLISTSVDHSVNFQNTAWYQEAYIKAPNAETTDTFGDAVAIDADTIAVNAPNEDSNQTTITNGTTASANNGTSNAGAVYVFKRTGSNWAQEAYIKAPNMDIQDFFGNRDRDGVLSISKDTLVATTVYEDSNPTTITNGATASADNSAGTSGAAYVFRRSGSTWAQEAFIKASNSETSDKFGSATSLSGDTLAVSSLEASRQVVITNGTTSSSNNSFPQSGAVFVYKRVGTTWAQEAYIKASNADSNDFFGVMVSLDNDTLAVGATSEASGETTIINGPIASPDNTKIDSGAVYIFKRSGTTWRQEAYIKAVNGDASDAFGKSVSISGDLLAVSAVGEASNQTTITNGTTASSDNSASRSGAVYVYKRTGSVWAQEAYVKASNSIGGSNFGYTTRISGSTLIVSATADKSNQTTITNDTTSSSNTSLTRAGAVFVYVRGSNGWYQEAYIKAGNTVGNSSYGYAIGISGDTIVVGDSLENSSQTTITNGSTTPANSGSPTSGAVYVYRNSQRLFEPASFTSNLTSANGIQLSWAGGGAKAVGFKIAYALGGTPPADCKSGTVVNVGNVNSYILSSLDGGQRYSFRICSYDSAGNLSPGLTSIFQTTVYSPEVATLTSTPNSLSQITFNWTTGGGTTAGYKLAWQLGGSAPSNCSSGTVVDLGAATSYQVTGLAYLTLVGVRVCSYTSTGQLSTGTSLIAESLSAPEPTNLYITSTATSSAVLRWTSGTGVTTGFRVAWTLGKVAPMNCQSGTNLDVGNVTSYTVSGLTEGQQIAARICSYAVSGTDISRGKIVTGASFINGWHQEAYLKASNGDSSRKFGSALSIEGDTLVVAGGNDGSNQTTITNGQASSTNTSLPSSGATFVYKRIGSNWIQEAYIKAVNADINDFFGASVSIDRDTIAVGATGEASTQTTITNGATASSINTLTNGGAVYVYKRTGANWTQEAYIKPSNPDMADGFGYSVKMHADTLLVSTQGEDSNQVTITNGTTASLDNSKISSGAAYVYKRTGTTWAQEAFIKAANADTSDIFGIASSFHRDTVAIGAPNESSNQTTITNGTTASTDNTKANAGAVYIYKRTGVTWAQEAYIKPSNANNTQAFGGSVGIDGDTLVVDAYNENSNQTTITNGATASADVSATAAGAVYIFGRSGATWTQKAYIKAFNNTAGNNFGKNVAISGNTIVVGALNESSSLTTITNGAAPTVDTLAATSGAAYVYVRNGATWTHEAHIKAINGATQDNFGDKVSISGDTIAIGTFNEDAPQTYISNGTSADMSKYATTSGAVYVYRNNARLFEVPDLWGSTAAGSITLNWFASGGSTTGYTLAYQTGATAPATCALGTVSHMGNVLTHTESSLSSATTYSFRVCSEDGSSTSEGVTITLTTP